MFRKMILGLTAATALSAAALAPTAASAHWFGHGHGFWGPHVGLYVGPGYGPGYYDSCVHRQWIATPYGPRLRWINTCY
jgi:hypothetical protein